MISKIKQIINGYYRLMFSNYEARMEGVRRLDICSYCEHKKRFTCGECGCVLAAKVMCSFCECPKNKW